MRTFAPVPVNWSTAQLIYKVWRILCLHKGKCFLSIDQPTNSWQVKAYSSVITTSHHRVNVIKDVFLITQWKTGKLLPTGWYKMANLAHHSNSVCIRGSLFYRHTGIQWISMLVIYLCTGYPVVNAVCNFWQLIWKHLSRIHFYLVAAINM